MHANNALIQANKLSQHSHIVTELQQWQEHVQVGQNRHLIPQYVYTEFLPKQYITKVTYYFNRSKHKSLNYQAYMSLADTHCHPML